MRRFYRRRHQFGSCLVMSVYIFINKVVRLHFLYVSPTPGFGWTRYRQMRIIAMTMTITTTIMLLMPTIIIMIINASVEMMRRRRTE